VFESVVFAVVKVMVGLLWLAGSDHSACAEVPTGPKEVPVRVTVVPAHASFGLTDVSCQAEAAWAPVSGPRRPRVRARMAARVMGRGFIARPFGVREPLSLVALNALMMISLAS
jgi:hypothetical protein